jgi:hypothetical protein
LILGLTNCIGCMRVHFMLYEHICDNQKQRMLPVQRTGIQLVVNNR